MNAWSPSPQHFSDYVSFTINIAFVTPVIDTCLVIIIYRLLNEIIWLSTEKEGVELTGGEIYPVNRDFGRKFDGKLTDKTVQDSVLRRPKNFWHPIFCQMAMIQAAYGLIHWS